MQMYRVVPITKRELSVQCVKNRKHVEIYTDVKQFCSTLYIKWFNLCNLFKEPSMAPRIAMNVKENIFHLRDTNNQHPKVKIMQHKVTNLLIHVVTKIDLQSYGTQQPLNTMKIQMQKNEDTYQVGTQNKCLIADTNSEQFKYTHYSETKKVFSKAYNKNLIEIMIKC